LRSPSRFWIAHLGECEMHKAVELGLLR
jgi:hypothetical protein